jgi:hypothetical protein
MSNALPSIAWPRLTAYGLPAYSALRLPARGLMAGEERDYPRWVSRVDPH